MTVTATDPSGATGTATVRITLRDVERAGGILGGCQGSDHHDGYRGDWLLTPNRHGATDLDGNADTDGNCR